MMCRSLIARSILILLLHVPGLAALSLGDARRAIETGDEPRARVILEQMIRSSGDGGERPDAILLLASIEHVFGARMALLEEFARRYRTHRAWPDVCHDLAWLYASQERYADAALVLSSLKELPAKREGALLGLARIALVQEQWSQAERYCTLLETEYPAGSSRAAVLACRARIHQAGGRMKEASLAWHAILERHGASPEAPGAWYALGEMAVNERDVRLARDYLSKLVEAFPGSLEAGLARSRLRLLTGEKSGSKNVQVWEVQLAVYLRRDQAEGYVNRLKSAGYLSFVQEETVSGRVQYSVRMGYFRTSADAMRVLGEMKSRGHEGFIRTRTVTVTEDELGR